MNNKKHPCECDKEVYNNKNCCYIRPKDVSIIQVNDKELFQAVTKESNLCLTSIPIEINTDGYLIESSVIERPNDTIVIKESGLYSISFSLKYSFRFNDNMINKEICNISFAVKVNENYIFDVQNTINRPIMMKEESRDIINTIQGRRLLIVDEEVPYNINICLKSFDFEIVSLEQVLISDLVMIIEKVI